MSEHRHERGVLDTSAVILRAQLTDPDDLAGIDGLTVVAVSVP